MTSSFRARSAIGVAALLVAGLLAGCEDEDPPDASATPSAPSPPVSTSSAVSTSTATGPVEPTMPIEAEADDKAAVEAFVTFYWEVVNYATKTGDVQLLRDLDQPSCDGCARGIEGIERIYGRGGRITGGEYKVIRLQPARSPSGHWSVIARTRIATQRTVGAGDLNGTFPGGQARWLLGVARVRGTWNITTLEGL